MIEQGNQQDRLLDIKYISVQVVAKWWRLYPVIGSLKKNVGDGYENVT